MIDYQPMTHGDALDEVMRLRGAIDEAVMLFQVVMAETPRCLWCGITWDENQTDEEQVHKSGCAFVPWWQKARKAGHE